MSAKKSLYSNILLFLTSIVWGLAFAAQKTASAHQPPFAVNCYRFFLGGLVLIPVILIFDCIAKSDRHLFRAARMPIDLTRHELLGGFACGVALMLAASLQQISLSSDNISPGKASFLTALYVVFVPVFGLLRRKIAAANVWVSVLIAIGGAYLLTSNDLGGSSIGIYDVLLLCSAAMFALQITLIDIFAPKADPVRMSMVEFFTVALLNIPFVFFVDPHLAPIPTAADFAAAIPSLLYLGLLSSGLAYTAQVIGQKMSGTPTVSSIIMSLESVFGLLGGVIILNETMNGYQIAGCFVILFAVAFSQLPLHDWIRAARRKKTSPTDTSENVEGAPPPSSEHPEDTR